MKKVFALIMLLIVLIVGFLMFRRYQYQKQIELVSTLETVSVERGLLTSSIDATGIVRSQQNAYLNWKTNGTVSEVFVTVGDQVSKGQKLAVLKSDSLPQYIILAQADLISAQMALDNLLNSDLQRTQAQKNIEIAQQALEDALNPEIAQAKALVALAEAEKDVEDAQNNLTILTNPVPQSAIDQAYANMVIAENILNQTLADIERFERRSKGKLPPFVPDYLKKEIKGINKDILEALELKRTQDQLKYNDAVSKYNQLLDPPNPNDVAVATSKLATAKAQFVEAQREWERVKDGPSEADIAVLEAKLADAKREWERIKDGPDPDDIEILETRIAAAQAAIDHAHITAPFDGVITSIEIQSGDQAQPGMPAFRLDNTSRLFVDVQVSEIYINQVELGQEAQATFDSTSNEYHGTVVEVTKVGMEVDGLVSFEVAIELSDADSAIKPGMTSEIEIITDQIEEALLIPNRAVQIQGDQRVVYILSETPLNNSPAIETGAGPLRELRDLVNPNNRVLYSLQTIPIKLGASSATRSEVLEGDLKPGDEILLNPPSMTAMSSTGFRIISPVEGGQ
jgi:HlyD family secretion protein